MRNLYILKFEESLDPSVWFSESSDKLTLQEIKNFTSFANLANFRTILVSYNEPSWVSPNCGTDFINIEEFKNLQFSSEDVVIFWTGYNHSNRESSAKAGLHWYQAMISLRKKKCQDYVLCTDTRCVMMQPSFFLDNPVYKPYFQAHMEELNTLNTYPVEYLTQAADTDKYLEVINKIEGSHKYNTAYHLPLHLLPLVSHKQKEINEQPNYDYLYYGNSVTDFRADNYRIKNLVKYFTSSEWCMGDPKLILNNISGYVPDVLHDVEFSDRIPYSEIKHMLNKAMVSVCLSEDDYQYCQLIPNRVVEGIAAKGFIAVHSELLNGIDIGLETEQIFSTPEELIEIINKCIIVPEFRETIIYKNQELLETSLNTQILIHELKCI